MSAYDVTGNTKKIGNHEIWTRKTDENTQSIAVDSSAETFVPTGIKLPKMDTDVDLTRTKKGTAKLVLKFLIDDMRDNLNTKLDADPNSPNYSEFVQWNSPKNLKNMTPVEQQLFLRAAQFQNGTNPLVTPIEIGDRLMWEAVLANTLAQTKGGYPTDPLADRTEAYFRYFKVLWLNNKYQPENTVTYRDGTGTHVRVPVTLDKSGNPTKSELTLGSFPEAYLANPDYHAYTEYRPEIYMRVWKPMPKAAVGRSYLGIAIMMLDDVGRGRNDGQLQKLYGANDDVIVQKPNMSLKDAILTVAIDYAKKAQKALIDDSNPAEAKERDFYAIGQAIITEARLRALRRKTDQNGEILPEDDNDHIKSLLNQFLDQYDIDKNITIAGETKTVEAWMNSNEKLTKYGGLSTPLADTKSKSEIVTLAKIGIVYLRGMAELEIAKRAMDADAEDYDQAVTEIMAALKKANGVLNDLVLVGENGRITNMMAGLSEGGKLYADKTADYLSYDALKTKADLMQQLGNIIGANFVTINGEKVDGDTLLARAKNIYEEIDDIDDPNINNHFVPGDTGDLSPYQDIRDLSAVGRMLISRQQENTDLKTVTKDISKYYDPSEQKDKEYLGAPVYPGSYMYYVVNGNEEVELNLRNGTFGELTIRNEVYRDKLMTLPGSKRPEYDQNSEIVVVADAAFARSLGWETIAKIDSVKATNRNGIRENKFRYGYLEVAKADARLLKFITNDDDMLAEVDRVIGEFQDIIINLAKEEIKGLPGAIKKEKDEANKAKLVAKLADLVAGIKELQRCEDLKDDGAKAKAKADFVDKEYDNMINNTKGKRKYNKMDYPFYAELYNELASLYEQRAWLFTKDERERLVEADLTDLKSKYYTIIKPEFDKAVKAYKKVFDPEYAKEVKDLQEAINKEKDETKKAGLAAELAGLIRTGPGICMHEQILGNYDKYARRANNEVQLNSIKSYTINTDLQAEKPDDICGVNGKITQIDRLIDELHKINIEGVSIEDLYKKPTSEEDGVKKVVVNKAGGGTIKLLKEAIDVLHARVCDAEAQLINKKIFFINRQNMETETFTPADMKIIMGTLCKDPDLKKYYDKYKAVKKVKDILVSYYYSRSRNLSEMALDKLTDPYYLIQSMVGASMVYMLYNKKKAVDNIYEYYTKRLGENAILSYEMCEAFSIAAAVKKDVHLARNIIKSLETVIPNTKKKLISLREKANTTLGQEEKDRIEDQIRSYKDIYSQAYMWKGNLKSWFYEERTENGDPTALTEALECFTNSLDIVNGNPDNLSSQLNLKLVEYRLANLDYKDKTRADLDGIDDVTNLRALVDGKYGGFRDALMNIADNDVKLWAPNDAPKRMSAVERKLREEQYYASKATACRAMKMMVYIVMNFMQKNKKRLVDWKDKVPTTMGVYFEQRFMKGDIVNDTLLVKINEARAGQIDESRNSITLEQLTEQNGAVKPAPGATLSLKQVQNLFNPEFLTWLGVKDNEGRAITSIREASMEGDVKCVADALLAKEKAIRDENLVNNKDYNMDLDQLMAFSVSDIEVLGSNVYDLGTNYTVNPTEDNWNKFAAAAQNMEDSKEPLVQAQGYAIMATVYGWSAMISENVDDLEKVNLNKAIELYDKAAEIYTTAEKNLDDEILKNEGEVKQIKYYKLRDETSFTDCIGAFKTVSEQNQASIGGMADINVSTMYIADASGKSEKVKEGLYKKAWFKALEAVRFLTGIKYKEEDYLDPKLTQKYIDYIKTNDVLKKDKLVIEALSNLVIAEAWYYTTRSAEDRIGGLKTEKTDNLSKNYGFDVKSKAGNTVQVGKAYLDIRKKLWDVYLMALPVAMREKDAPKDLSMITAKKYSEQVKDRDLRSYVHHLSHSGLVFTMSQVQYSYGVSTWKTSALKELKQKYGGDEKMFFENAYLEITWGTKEHEIQGENSR